MTVSIVDQKMNTLLLLFGLFACSFSLSADNLVREEWESFKLEHKKNYDSETEESFRLNIFMENKNLVAKHNQKYHLGHVSYKLGLNKYADMLHSEFVSTLNGFNKSLSAGFAKAPNGKSDGVPFIKSANVQLPKFVDWRTKGIVLPIKDQGHCGSCWAFSAVASLEGLTARKTGVLTSLSEQNLLDCSKSYGNNGCMGGLMDLAFKYIKANDGIDTEKSYPYEAVDDTCHFDPTTVGATDRGYVDIPKGDEIALQEAVATVGPVSIAIDASRHTFMLYTDGVYNDPECSSELLDHGVVIVGYGTDPSGEDYWLVRNSWGITWGMDGYIKMSRNKDNQCGVATQASHPLV